LMLLNQAKSKVVPTPVGVNRRCLSPFPHTESCPHARGGEPYIPGFLRIDIELSPRPWG